MADVEEEKERERKRKREREEERERERGRERERERERSPGRTVALQGVVAVMGELSNAPLSKLPSMHGVTAWD